MKHSANFRLSPLARALIGLVSLYRLVPRMGPPRCRFHPTCSAYALEALQTHGAVRGGALTVRRLLRCHPFHPGGVDHVPPVAVGAPVGPAAGLPHAVTGRDSLLKGSLRV